MKLYLYAAAGAIILVAVAYFIHDQRETGRQQEQSKQDKVDAEFRKRVREGASAYDACDFAGGVYDFAKRTCNAN